MILAGDIGGTNTRLTLFDYTAPVSIGKEKDLVPIRKDRFSSKDYPHLSKIISEFLQIANTKVLAACLGVPGPVSQGVAQTTNLPWQLSEAELQTQLGIPIVRLVNDHALTSYAIPFLSSNQTSLVYPGQEDREQTIFGVIAPGTGLGQGMLIKHGTSYLTASSEGGHVEFAPRSEHEIDLLRFMWQKLGKRVSVERLLSGPGILNVYEFERSLAEEPEPAWLTRAIAEHGPKAITQATLDDQDVVCTKTIALFSEILGSHCGNVVLSYMSTAGVYLGGGIVSSIKRFIEREEVITAYTTKGRLSQVVERTPIYIIEDSGIALNGAARMALTLIGES